MPKDQRISTLLKGRAGWPGATNMVKYRYICTLIIQYDA